MHTRHHVFFKFKIVAFFFLYVFLFSIPGENAFHVTPLPSGVCSYCCPIDVNRDIEYLVYTR